MISLENVSYTYPRSDAPVLSGYSCSFECGEITAITGENGCGKTTLTKLIVGMLRPDSGVVRLDGADNKAMDLFDIGRLVGYVFQDPRRQLFCATVYDEIAYGLKNMKLPSDEIEEKTAYYMDLFRLAKYRNLYPGKLSQGEKQRLVLAAVLAMGTRYVILDEPTTGLDMCSRSELGELLLKIKADGKGVVFVSHERSFIETYADRELVIS